MVVLALLRSWRQTRTIMANTPRTNSPYPSSSLAESTPINIHDYSLWYQPPQPDPQLQQQEHEEPTFQPEPEPEPLPEPELEPELPELEPEPQPVSFQAPLSPRTLRTMYEQLPPLQLVKEKTPPPLDSTAKNRLRREKAKERERQRPGISAMLPDEIIIDPPHDPDEKVPVPYVRSCSMARQDVPQGMRCVVMLRADYTFRMCEGCRMRFKLAEVRSKGIRYQGKYKARGETGDARGTKLSKVRMTSFCYRYWNLT